MNNVELTFTRDILIWLDCVDLLLLPRWLGSRRGYWRCRWRGRSRGNSYRAWLDWGVIGGAWVADLDKIWSFWLEQDLWKGVSEREWDNMRLLGKRNREKEWETISKICKNPYGIFPCHLQRSGTTYWLTDFIIWFSIEPYLS